MLIAIRLCFLFTIILFALSSRVVYAQFSPLTLIEDKPYKETVLALNAVRYSSFNHGIELLTQLQRSAQIGHDPVASYYYYLGKFKHHRAHKRPLEARKALDAMQQIGIQKSVPWIVAESDMWLATFDITDGHYDVALQRANRALLAAKKLRYLHLEARTHNLIAVIHSSQNRQLQAKKSYTAALEIFRSIGDAAYVVKVISNISLIYADLEEWDKALEYNQEGYFWLQKSHQPQLEQEAILALNRSIIAGNIGSLSEQSEYLDLAELKADQLGDVSLIANVKSNKAYNSLEKGHYRQAEWLAQECLSLAEKYQIKTQVPHCITHLGRALSFLGNSSTAESLLISAKDQFIALKDPLNTAKAYNHLANFYAGQQHFDTAYRYARLYQEENEILLFDRRQKALFELEQVHADTEQQHKITQLHTENKLKQTRINYQESKEKMWAAIFVAGMFGFLLLFKSKNTLQQQNISLLSTNHSLREQSMLDSLTRIPNRRFAEHYLSGDRALPGKGHIAIGLIDIDHFKDINDKLGHAAGDIVLQEVAQTLNSVLLNDDLLARWGGEEFLIIVRADTLAQLQDRLTRLRTTVETTSLYFDEGRLTVTASIGATLLSPANYQRHWRNKLDIADKHLYQAKSEGRNKVVFA
ncbi:diguanylate cyclase [Vibrio mediterranei]